MRELQLSAPESRGIKVRGVKEYVHKLQFVADGSELIGWVDEERFRRNGPEELYGTVLLRCSLATGTNEWMELPYFFDDGASGPFAGPMLSPDGRFLAAEIHINGYDEANNTILLSDISSGSFELPNFETSPIGFAGLLFTPDSKALIAVWNGPDGFVSGIGRFSLSCFPAPTAAGRDRDDWLSDSSRGEQKWAWDPKPNWGRKWKTLIAKPGWTHAVAATLSADGRFLAVVDELGHFHAADLKTKHVTATLEHDGRAPRGRIATRIAFDPAAQWIVQLVAGRLFARPLGTSKPWQTTQKLGYVHDFAFHPNGHIICAVFRDGEARYLDPLTGKVQQSFKWAKKPKPLYSVAFSPDGLTCAAGGENGQVILWDVDG